LSKDKRPPFWKPIERARFDAIHESWDDVRARVLTPEERDRFDVEVPYSMRAKPYDYVLNILGLSKEKGLPEGSGAGFVQSPYADIYTTVYGVTPIADLPKYRIMYRTQPDFQQAVQLQVTMSIGKGFVVEHKNQKVQKYCNKIVDDINLLQDLIALSTDMLVYGFAAGEIQWSDKVLQEEQIYSFNGAELTSNEVFSNDLNGKVEQAYVSGSTEPLVANVLKREHKKDKVPLLLGVKPLDPLYIRVRRDSFGNVYGYVQILSVPYTYIDPENMLFLKFRPTSTGFENAYGHSIFMSLIKNNDLLMQFENDAYIWVHGRAVPPLIAQGGADPQHPYTTGQMDDLMSKLGGRTAASIIGVKSDVNIIELQGAARNLNLNWWLNYLLTRRYQALGVPPILMGVTE